MTTITPANVKRDSWQYRAVEATRGNQTLMGAVMICVLGHMPKHPPRLHGLATINKSGFVRCAYQSKNDPSWRLQAVGKIEDIRDGLRKLADLLKLTDTERTEMFAAVRLWIEKDERAEHDREELK